VSTRLVGALIMTHSDDDGLVLPPRLAPKHVVILPDEMQKNLFDRALALREENTRRIDSLDDFRAFFPKDEAKIFSGGFALCHFTEGDETMQQVLAELKVTPRCIPVDAEDEPGKCIFTGQPSARRAVFAKAY
jgi:prolyl-tRNA synthetase